jgi:HEAT repeat protein
VLGPIGADPTAAVPALTEALQDADFYVRWRAAGALGAIGTAAAAAVPALMEALRDPVFAVREEAAEALKRFRPS